MSLSKKTGTRIHVVIVFVYIKKIYNKMNFLYTEFVF